MEAMSNDLEDTRKELDKEFEQFRKRIGKLHEKLEKLEKLGPTDDIYDEFSEFEDIVKEIRTGGMIGSGLKGHREAREKYNESRNK